MLGRLLIKIKSEEKITYQKSSLFQGVLMEQIDCQYAEILHLNGLKPYSENLHFQDGLYIWEINVLSKEAYDKIFPPLLSSDFREIKLKHSDQNLEIMGKELLTFSYQDFIDQYYIGECPRYITIRFRTPTAFKQNGRYIFYPDLQLIYKSILGRHDSFSSIGEFQDDSFLEQLLQHSEIIRYDLRSTSFSLEGVRIPAFTGKITLKLHGPQPMVNVIHYLFHIGEFSGVGIKTAVGMGALMVEKHVSGGERQKNDGY